MFGTTNVKINGCGKNAQTKICSQNCSTVRLLNSIDKKLSENKIMCVAVQFPRNSDMEISIQEIY